MPKNYLITGLPRSGTTLLTYLLSENFEAVTFSEPEWLKEIRAKSDNCLEFSMEFEKKLDDLRNDIRNEIPVFIKDSRYNLGQPQNYYRRNNNGKVIIDKDESPITFPLDYADKPFIIKANAQFTSCLSELTKNNNYEIVCVVRNPVASIMSWRSLNLPVSRGNMKVAEKYNSSFLKEVNSKSLLKKQVLIADWFFKQYKLFQDDVILIRYEALINDTIETLSKIIPNKLIKTPILKSKNKNKYYNQEEVIDIRNCLIENEVSINQYYKI